MRRREFITLFGGAAATWPLAARAQQTGRVPHIGVLFVIKERQESLLAALRQGLSDLGHVEGRTFILDVSSAGGLPNRVPALAAELVERKVDVIMVDTAVSALAVSQATVTIPIVQAGGGDPTRSSGLAKSLARPGGNLTGLVNQNEDLSAKWLELLLLLVPGALRIGVLLTPGAPVTEPQLRQIEQAARSLGVTIEKVAVPDAAALDTAFATLVRANVEGAIVLSSALLAAQSPRAAELAARAKLPTIYPYNFFVHDGGLLSYGVNVNDNWRQAARFVDRILKGAHPSDLPIEQPTKFELVINLKTAKALGLTVPPTLLARADKVIE